MIECVDKCHKPVENVLQIMKEETNEIENKFSSIIMACEDMFKLPVKSSATEIKEYKGKVDHCIDSRADNLIPQVPKIYDRVLKRMEKLK